MKKRDLKFTGIILVILGVIILVNSYTTITGLTILNETTKTTISILGIMFVVGGILLLMTRGGKGRLERLSDANVNLEPTEKFTKSIRRHNLADINAAIRKIGTGKGKEERLKGGDGYSIRVSKGGRVLFDYDDSHSTAILEEYNPQHYE